MGAHRGSFPTPTLAIALVLSVACGPLELVQAPDPSVGLVAHWTFDESTGSLVGDHSGQGHDGVLTGGTWRPTGGHLGGALFLASGDYVTVTGFPAATPDWTVSAWVRYAPADIGTDLSTIVTTEIPSTGGWELQGPVNADTVALQFSYNRDSRYITLQCCQIKPDTWMHVTAVVNGAAPEGQRTATLYDGSTAAVVLPVSGPILPGNATLHIGIEEIPGKLEWPFRGTIDELRIYDRALNPAEVQSLDALAL
jgi:hypothetical protein